MSITPRTFPTRREARPLAAPILRLEGKLQEERQTILCSLIAKIYEIAKTDCPASDFHKKIMNLQKEAATTLDRAAAAHPWPASVPIQLKRGIVDEVQGMLAEDIDALVEYSQTHKTADDFYSFKRFHQQFAGMNDLVTRIQALYAATGVPR